jgi:P-type Ca2+ transporter type 2C
VTAETVAPGLTAAEAAARLISDGPNALAERPRTPWWRHLLAQLASPLIWLLAAAAAASGALGQRVEAAAILAIVALNALVGFVQEYRAESSVRSLRAMTAPRARVLRGGAQAVVPAAEVVRGDALLLEQGDIVAADAELTEAHRLSTVEASLTGESLPSEKSITKAPADAPLAAQTHRVFMGTPVAMGSGRAVVTATGARTELGKIATLLDTAQEAPTPLQVQLARVGRSMMLVCLGVVALVAGAGALRGRPWLELLVSSIALAVAAVPEGLPAVVTIALAVGVQRMAKRHVLVRHLPSVETLGSVTVIVTDKTGTLTTGRMVLRETWGDADAVLRAAAADVDASLDETGAWGVGDPTELAILVAAKARGVGAPEIDAANPRVRVNPFDAERKRMSTLRRDGVLYVKGALGGMVPLCVGGTEGAEAAATAMASKGLRVLAVATGRGAEEVGLTLVGLVGIADPPRPEAVRAIAEARAAGVRVVVATGDAKVTAEAIAREMGIVRAGEEAAESVHARITPEGKLQLVRALKEKGEVVAMTGDGTNDAPALKEAHIGIAMGIAGTEVTREAADMVLADDNFASVVAAVREGRSIFDNIQKTLVYLLAGNAGELLTLLVAAALGLPLPLLPLQLLWVNLMTDGLPALALVTDPADDEVLARPPRPPSAPMLGRAEWLAIGGRGLLVGGATLGAFAYELGHDTLRHARSTAFAVLVFAQIFNAFAARSLTRTFLSVGPFSNPRLLAVSAATVLLQLGLMAFGPTRRLFDLGPFSARVVLIGLVAGLAPMVVTEVVKVARRVRT